MKKYPSMVFTITGLSCILAIGNSLSTIPLQLSYSSPEQVSDDDLQGESTKYSNATNGLTFEYPSEWVIKYFESYGQVIEITNPDRNNGIIIRIPDESTQIIMMRYSSLEEAANTIIGKVYGMNITEPFIEKIINGLPAAMGKVSGDVPLESGTNKQIAQLAWIYHLGTIYSFQYYDVDNKFNSAESQDIMNRFILTFNIA